MGKEDEARLSLSYMQNFEYGHATDKAEMLLQQLAARQDHKAELHNTTIYDDFSLIYHHMESPAAVKAIVLAFWRCRGTCKHVYRPISSIISRWLAATVSTRIPQRGHVAELI